MYSEAITTSDNKPVLRALVRNLPGMLSGRIQDEEGISEGFKLRIGFKILELVKLNFDELSRGFAGADGDVWPPLSKEYLAYGRRFGQGEMASLKKEAGLGRAHRHGPGESKGLLTAQQLKEWRQLYARYLSKFMLRGHTEQEAKSHAAAVAWTIMKERGAKTKLEVFGNRKVQILVDTGRGRGSLTPGSLYENGPKAKYEKPGGKGGSEQRFDIETDCIVVGTNVKYMSYHHNAKNKKRRRRLWPEKFPADWWQQILGIAISGLARIGELYNKG